MATKVIHIQLKCSKKIKMCGQYREGKEVVLAMVLIGVVSTFLMLIKISGTTMNTRFIPVTASTSIKTQLPQNNNQTIAGVAAKRGAIIAAWAMSASHVRRLRQYNTINTAVVGNSTAKNKVHIFLLHYNCI